MAGGWCERELRERERERERGREEEREREREMQGEERRWCMTGKAYLLAA